jgi:hypothetical protein
MKMKATSFALAGTRRVGSGVRCGVEVCGRAGVEAREEVLGAAEHG